MDALIHAMFERFGDSSLVQPQIHPRWNDDQTKRRYVVQAGKPAQLLVRGRNLWRNPIVLIGSQSAVTYQVQPDMEGLLAQFEDVLPVPSEPGNDTTAPTVDLRVVTSDGETVLKDAVTVLMGNDAGHPIPFVKITNIWSVVGQTINVSLDVTAAPKSYSSYILTLRSIGAFNIPVWTNSDPLALQKGKLSFKLPAKDVAEKVTADVWLKASPSAEAVSVLIGGEQPLILFTNESQAQFQLETNSITISTNAAVREAASSLKVIAPDVELFWDAWPGLKAAFQQQKAQLELKVGNRSAVLSAFTFEPPNQTAKFELIYSNLVTNLGLTNDSDTANAAASILFTSRKSLSVPAGATSIKRKDK